MNFPFSKANPIRFMIMHPSNPTSPAKKFIVLHFRRKQRASIREPEKENDKL